jgi:hypothetical protein
MLLTLSSTGVTNICTNPAKVGAEIAFKHHYFRRRTADRRTFQIQLDTFSKMCNIFFPQARGCTMGTRLRARKAGIDTFLKLLVGHNFQWFEEFKILRPYENHTTC